MRVETLDGAEAAARRGAELIAAAATAALDERGAFTLAVSGGQAPWRMFELLGEHDLDWDRIEVFQVDERVAPDGDDDRNLTHLLPSLPEPGRDRVRPMPVTARDLEQAAREYGAALPASLDCVHLGLGPDGHTASLVPDDPVLAVDDRPVALTSNEYQGRRRMTLTYPALDAARRIIWLVTGSGKADPLAKLLAADPSVPAGRVEQAHATVLTDAEARPA